MVPPARFTSNWETGRSLFHQLSFFLPVSYEGGITGGRRSITEGKTVVSNFSLREKGEKMDFFFILEMS